MPVAPEESTCAILLAEDKSLAKIVPKQEAEEIETRN